MRAWEGIESRHKIMNLPNLHLHLNPISLSLPQI